MLPIKTLHHTGNDPNHTKNVHFSLFNIVETVREFDTNEEDESSSVQLRGARVWYGSSSDALGMSVFVCVYISKYTSSCTCVRAHAYVRCVCVCVCMHAFASVHVCVCVCVCVHVHIRECVCKCVYMCEKCGSIILCLCTCILYMYTVQVTILITTISSTTDFIVHTLYNDSYTPCHLGYINICIHCVRITFIFLCFHKHNSVVEVTAVLKEELHVFCHRYYLSFNNTELPIT